jgi:hypothetical protein
MPQDGTGRPAAPTGTPTAPTGTPAPADPADPPDWIGYNGRADLADPAGHPAWCRPAHCTIEDLHPYGSHRSFAYAIEPDKSVHTRVYLQVTQMPGGVQPPLAVIEIGDTDDNENAFPLTPDQLRRIHDAVGELLTAIATP